MFDNVVNEEESKLVHFVAEFGIKDFREHLVSYDLIELNALFFVGLEQLANKFGNLHMELFFSLIVLFDKLFVVFFQFFVLFGHFFVFWLPLVAIHQQLQHFLR